MEATLTAYSLMSERAAYHFKGDLCYWPIAAVIVVRILLLASKSLVYCLENILHKYASFPKDVILAKTAGILYGSPQTHF